MATSAQAQTPKLNHFWKAWQVLIGTLGIGLFSAYPFGMLLNIANGEGANCADLMWISGCTFPNLFVLLFGLLYALPFWLGVFHFGFTDKKRWWYYIIIALFAKFLYVGADSLIYEVVAIGGGIAIGLTISMWRSNRSNLKA